MAWTVEYADSAQKQLRKLDKKAALRILDYMEERVARASNPRASGAPLQGPLGELWRYRVGDYRILCEIRDAVLRVLVVRIAHRSKAYRQGG